MILLILFIVAAFLWFLTLLPLAFPNRGEASGWLAFICVVLLFGLCHGFHQ
jgi:hypothetical protein